MLKKPVLIVLITAILASISLFSAQHALARDPLQGGLVDDYKTQIFDPAINTQDVNLQSTTYEMFLSLVSAMLRSSFATYGDLPPGVPFVPAQAPTDIHYAGLIPDLYHLNTHIITHPPISTANYLADAGSRLHLVSPAYAQGLGPSALQPVLRVWRGFRDIAYFLATLGFILLSFAIMFRVRLSPQTVVTAQTALGKLVIVFLAITFSYALASLMVDLIFVVSFLIITLFSTAGLIGVPAVDVQQDLLSNNPLHVLVALLTILQPAGDTIQTFLERILNADNAFGPLRTALQYVFTKSFSAIGQLIIGIAIVFSLFRLFIQLLIAYIEIIILTILGPIMILADILPGGRGTASWLRQLFANAMAFPTVTFMILLGIVLVGGNERFGVEGAVLDLAQGVQFPYIPGESDTLRSFIGIGIILMTPQAVKMVKDALKAESFFAKYTPAIGAAIGVGVSRGPSAIWQKAAEGSRLTKQAAQQEHSKYRAGIEGARPTSWTKRQFGI